MDVSKPVPVYEWNDLGFRIVRAVSVGQVAKIGEELGSRSVHGRTNAYELKRYVFFALQQLMDFPSRIDGEYWATIGFLTLDSQEPEKRPKDWYVEVVAVKKNAGSLVMPALDDQSRDLLASFLFGFLGLDPQKTHAYARGFLQVPFATVLHDAGPVSYDTNQDGLPFTGRIFSAYMRDLAPSWLSGPHGEVQPTANFPQANMVRLTCDFVEVDLQWNKQQSVVPDPNNPQIKRGGRTYRRPKAVAGEMVFRLRYGEPKLIPGQTQREAVIGPWKSTPQEAAEATGFLISEAELEDWLERHFVPGTPVGVDEDTMDGFELLGEEFPQLSPIPDFLEYMSGQGALP